MSKVIKVGFKLGGFKNNWKTHRPNISHMRRRNMSFTELEARRYNSELELVKERNCFFKRKNSNTLVVWLHGGAYSLGPFKWHLMKLGNICDTLGVDGALPDYPKTPEFTYKENLDYLLKFYKEVISKYDDFYLVGDSAGGGLALSFSLLLQEKGLKTPTGVYTFSPWLDLSNSVDTTEYESVDPFLSQHGLNAFARFYGGKDLKSQYVSPYYGDFSKLDSEIYVYSGTHEIFHGVALEFFKKNENVKQRVFDEMIHAWPLMPMPEAKAVIDEVIESIQGNLDQQSVARSA